MSTEWDNAAAFHNYYPKSNTFQAFVSKIKPFAAKPAVPELYEAQQSSHTSTSSSILQIIKAKSGNNTEGVWNELERAVSKLATEAPAFYHANGIENDEGNLVGLIGWKSLQVSSIGVP